MIDNLFCMIVSSSCILAELGLILICFESRRLAVVALWIVRVERIHFGYLFSHLWLIRAGTRFLECLEVVGAICSWVIRFVVFKVRKTRVYIILNALLFNNLGLQKISPDWRVRPPILLKLPPCRTIVNLAQLSTVLYAHRRATEIAWDHLEWAERIFNWWLLSVTWCIAIAGSRLIVIKNIRHISNQVKKQLIAASSAHFIVDL